jgi:predicted flap endonuclease-1-like 5' DNA nuclease
MQEFFMDYGLWLLIGLLVVIGLVFLLSGKGKTADAPPEMPVTTAEVIDTTPISSPLAPPSPAVVIETVPVEPIAVEPIDPVVDQPVPEPESQSAPIPVSPASVAAPSQEDDLLRLKGVGPKLKTLLISLGVTRYAQIAQWTDADLAAIDAKLGTFRGRPVRDQWIDQAKYLAAGDIAGFEAKYGKL